MAVYEFRCKKCKRKFAVTCHIEERDAKAVCPKCSSHEVAQKYTADFSSPRPDKYWPWAGAQVAQPRPGSP